MATTSQKLLVAGTITPVAEVALALAHTGAVGVIVGGIIGAAAYVGVEDFENLVGGNLPSRPARKPREEGKPSMAARLFVGKSMRGSAEEEDTDVQASLDQRTEREQDDNRFLILADNLKIDIDEFFEAGVFVSGMKGSGKSEFAARLMEQLGPFPVAQVVFDIKGDFVSLPDSPYWPSGVIMTKDQQYDAETIISCGLQVVVDLRTWQTSEERVGVIARLCHDLLTYARTLPDDERVPWVVHVDEAQQYTPQMNAPHGVRAETWTAAIEGIANLGVLGRAYGAVPCVYTQRIATVHKDVISQPEMRVLMKVALDNDLRRYFEEYLSKQSITREEVQAFRAGDAVVLLPTGEQVRTRFTRRQTKHGSHTPHLTQALRNQQRRRSQFHPRGGREVPAVPSQVREESEKDRDALIERCETEMWASRSPSRENFPRSDSGIPADRELPDHTIPKEGVSERVETREVLPDSASPFIPKNDDKMLSGEQAEDIVYWHRKVGTVNAALAKMGITNSRYRRHAAYIVELSKQKRGA